MKIEINGRKRVDIRGVAMSEIQNTKLSYDKDYDRVYKKFFNLDGSDLKPYQFLRSSIFEIKIDGQTNEVSENELEIPVDFVYSFDREMDSFKKRELYCLAELEEG